VSCCVFVMGGRYGNQRSLSKKVTGLVARVVPHGLHMLSTVPHACNIPPPACRPWGPDWPRKWRFGCRERLFTLHHALTGCRGKTNFFEKRVGDYQKAGVMSGLNNGGNQHAISFDEDF